MVKETQRQVGIALRSLARAACSYPVDGALSETSLLMPFDV